MEFNSPITIPLYAWLILAAAIAIVAFLAGWRLHRLLCPTKRAKRERKGKREEPLPEGWSSWKI